MRGNKGRPGRPQREPNPGERVGLSLRVTPETKRLIEQTADASGRSLSQEAEFRLENSFRTEGAAIDGMRLLFGAELAGFLLMIGRTARNIGTLYDTFAGTGAGEPSAWIHSPFAFDRVIAAITEIGVALRPEGDGSIPPELTEMDDFADRLADREAHRVIDAVRGLMPDLPQLRDLREFGAVVAALLGPMTAVRFERKDTRK